MKYVFRGNVVFEYIPNQGVRLNYTKVVDGLDIPAYDYCCFIDEDYKLMSEFFDKVYRHTQGENVKLEDIEVY